MQEQTNLEKATSHPVTQIVTQAVAIASSATTPVAAFLPTLFSALASGRQMRRIENTLIELNQAIESLRIDVNSLTDEQIKFISEATISICSTLDQQKLDYLKQAIQNSLTRPTITEQSSYILSRIIRDISPIEIEYLLNNIHIKLYAILEKTEGATTDIHYVKPDSAEERIVTSLINLGVLYTRSSGWGGIQVYAWAPIVENLVALFSSSTSPKA